MGVRACIHLSCCSKLTLSQWHRWAWCLSPKLLEWPHGGYYRFLAALFPFLPSQHVGLLLWYYPSVSWNNKGRHWTSHHRPFWIDSGDSWSPTDREQHMTLTQLTGFSLPKPCTWNRMIKVGGMVSICDSSSSAWWGTKSWGSLVFALSGAVPFLRVTNPSTPWAPPESWTWPLSELFNFPGNIRNVQGELNSASLWFSSLENEAALLVGSWEPADGEWSS